MKLANNLLRFLDRNGLTVHFNGSRIAVHDREGKVICTGATVHTAVRKAVWLNPCSCKWMDKSG
ncbi:MAG: hypothetical protein MESAZ_00406 [Saezia sanguinis]